MDSIHDLEIGKVRAGEYLIEGFRVYRDCSGYWTIEGARDPLRRHMYLRVAKSYIYEHVTGVWDIRKGTRL